MGISVKRGKQITPLLEREGNERLKTKKDLETPPLLKTSAAERRRASSSFGEVSNNETVVNLFESYIKPTFDEEVSLREIPILFEHLLRAGLTHEQQYRFHELSEMAEQDRLPDDPELREAILNEINDLGSKRPSRQLLRELRRVLVEAQPAEVHQTIHRHPLVQKKDPTVEDVMRLLTTTMIQREHPASLDDVHRALSTSGSRFLRLAEKNNLDKPVITVAIARIGGEDGVWLEVEKQIEMWGPCYDFHIVTGEVQSDPAVLGLEEATKPPIEAVSQELVGDHALAKVTVVPELAFSDQENVDIERKIGEICSDQIDLETGHNIHEPEELIGEIKTHAKQMQADFKALFEAAHANGSSIIVSQNLQAIPMHKPAGLALHNLFNQKPEEGGIDFGGLYVPHLHDFITDRMPERYLPAVTFENVYQAKGIGDLTSSDLRNCGLLLEHLKFAYSDALPKNATPKRVLAQWKQDFDARCQKNLALGDDPKAQRFEDFLGFLYQIADHLPQFPNIFDAIPKGVTPAVRQHVRWALSHGRMSTDPLFNTMLMGDVLDEAFPGKDYRKDIPRHLWTINEDSGRICKQITGQDSIYFPNIFQFPKSWKALVERVERPAIKAKNTRIGQILERHGINKEDKLLTTLVRIVPRKQLELAIDTLAELVQAERAASVASEVNRLDRRTSQRLDGIRTKTAHGGETNKRISTARVSESLEKYPEEPYKLAFVGSSGDEGMAYEKALREQIVQLGLEDRVVWLGEHVGNDSQQEVGEREQFTPIEWTDYLRERKSVEVYPSKIEGWGNRLGELASQGVAAVVHPYKVFMSTIAKDLKEAGIEENPYHTVEYGDEGLKGDILAQIHDLFEDEQRYDQYAHNTFDAMKKCYSYEEVRKRMQASVPTPAGPDAGDEDIGHLLVQHLVEVEEKQLPMVAKDDLAVFLASGIPELSQMANQIWADIDR